MNTVTKMGELSNEIDALKKHLEFVLTALEKTKATFEEAKSEYEKTVAEVEEAEKEIEAKTQTLSDIKEAYEDGQKAGKAELSDNDELYKMEVIELAKEYLAKETNIGAATSADKIKEFLYELGIREEVGVPESPTELSEKSTE